jgi:hypothetical protein
LNALLAVIIKKLGGICFQGELCLDAVGNRSTFVGREMQFGVARMFELDEQGFDLTLHADAATPASIITFDIDTCKLVSCHVELNSVIFFEKIKEMVEVFYPNIFDTKVIHNEAELNGSPFVAP